MARSHKAVTMEIADAMARVLHAKSEADTNGGCLLWRGKTYRQGYGAVAYKNSNYLVHRLAYVHHYRAEISGDVIVRHKCDTTACINPLHLELGDNADNTRDRTVRGRSHRWGGTRRGEGNPLSKLTWEQVAHIREMRSRGASSLAAQYGVSPSCVRSILLNKSWVIQ